MGEIGSKKEKDRISGGMFLFISMSIKECMKLVYY